MIKTIPAQASLFHNEEAGKYAFFLLSGTAGITNITADGREALTVRLSAGDICSMMVLSGLSGREYPGNVTAETEVTVLYVAKSSFLRWVQMYEPVRHAVFGSVLDGLIRMGSLLTEKSSLPLDIRLADTLLKLTSERQPGVKITHQQLAVELGSAREVVSRQLSRMLKKGWISTGRGSVSILQREALETFVGDQVTEEG
ncbi:Crp/Fnr family transcriptional regulator [Paenibacillus allorhizosphaerae]|nr:Crp/Fnr family transcriptional regulator [Paenibacillus allorhizosphaerae]